MLIKRDVIRELAAEVGLSLLAITTAEPFPTLAPLLIERIRSGYLRGMEWFNEDRALVSANPRSLHPTAQSIISVALPYWLPDIQPPNDGVARGRIARYAWGLDYHKTLRQRMIALHKRLEQVVGKPLEARYLVDTARILDRAVATRAGLGWQGKNTMVLVPHHGSWVLLGELVLDIELETDQSLRPRCGKCTRCLDACPTGALVSAYALYAPRCISYLTIEHRGSIPMELRPLMGDWVFGCDICQEVCPYTTAAEAATDPSVFPERPEHCYPPLEWILRLSEEEFRSVYRGRPVLRAKRAGLARNAAIALGNIGGPQHLAVLEETVLSHDHPLVRSHAAWAMAQIDYQAARPVLLRALAQESDTLARNELAYLLEREPSHVNQLSAGQPQWR